MLHACIAFSTGSDYAANIEMAEAVSPGPRPAASAAMREVETPTQSTCEDVTALLGVPLSTSVKAFAVVGDRLGDG